MTDNKSENLEKKANDILIFNLAGKLIGGYFLYKIGQLIGGEYIGIVGAFTGLKLNYYLNQYQKEDGRLGLEPEITFRKKK